MARLEDIRPNASVRGILPDRLITVSTVEWHGSDTISITFRSSDGRLGDRILYRFNEAELEVAEEGRPWSFDGDGAHFRLVSEAQRIKLAHLFDPLLAVHTSRVDPLPHQITAVYEEMLARQPLRFLLADDPGAGKTIMAGLFIKELIARGDLERCLIVCPGSLAEQWQDELSQRFSLPFEIFTNEKQEASRTGNWFQETNLVIARLDKLSRDEALQQKLKVDGGWDLIVCDEAHKMSGTFFSGEVKLTKRYKLGQFLSTLTRHFLLMTATPHNGKEADFQLFMALLDGDRFEGKFRDGVHASDTSDLMRRMVKENLLTFEATRLFPERRAHTVPYQLSDMEAALYKAVTEYVREEFNRAERLNEKKKVTVGFALMVLQRRLASSPEAIYQSLKRRKERLVSRLDELELIQRGGKAKVAVTFEGSIDADDIEELDDAPDNEVEKVEEELLDESTAAQTIVELKAEIDTLKQLESLANTVRNSGSDAKWRQLSDLLLEIFSARPEGDGKSETLEGIKASPHQKLVLFTEHRDTLNYLQKKISTLLGRAESVVVIHGGMGREDRIKVQEAFRNVKGVQVLVATDAAGEGINLQRAHLMVNYDLPWNPNRLEQRFGRIHRIGQKEVCHLWNLVAEGTREGDVYRTLLEKLEQAREALGGQVFDVLGKLEFDGKPLRDLLIEAIRYGDSPEIKARLFEKIAGALDRKHLETLIDDKSLVPDAMDVSRVRKIREEMERAEARRLQPHYIESFFIEAFKQFNGAVRQKEARRYEIKRVPVVVRSRDRLIGTREAISPEYERVVFEKDLIAPQGVPPGVMVCPGHPLLDSVLDLTLERHRDLLKRGAVLIDERDAGTQPRVLFYLDHSIRDASRTRSGEQRVVSRRMLYVEVDSTGGIRNISYAPYLDYRPAASGEVTADQVLSRPECSWITRDLEKKVMTHAIIHVVPEHLNEVSGRKHELIDKTVAAVKDRLIKEISYWDHRAQELQAQEQAGKQAARMNSIEAKKRAEELEGRLNRRLNELALERQLSATPPVVIGGVLVIPAGLLALLKGDAPASTPTTPDDTQISAARARAAVMETERRLGFDPVDRELEKLGYDIESKIPGTGKLRFIEVKGRVAGAKTITVTKNEILFSLNKPDDFILAIVEFHADDTHDEHYLRQPFNREPDFGVTSVNYDFGELLARSESPS